MHKRIRISPSYVLRTSQANLDSWIRSPRTMLMLIFVVSVCYLQVCGLQMTLEARGYEVNLIEALFYEFNFGCNMPMTTTLFLVMISELPRQLTFHQYSLIRNSRLEWALAQVLYCICMVIAMVLLILLCLSIMLTPMIDGIVGWSDPDRIANGIVFPEDALIDEYIRYFTPLVALIIAITPVFLFWLIMVLVVLLCGMYNRATFGVLSYAFITLSNVIIYYEFFPIDLRMPIHFATLKNIVAGYAGKEIEHLLFVVVIDMLIIFLLISTIIARAQKADLCFYPENRL